MWETAGSLYSHSFNMHQRLVDEILTFQGEDGLCMISRSQLSVLMDRSITWINNAIRRINTEDICIEEIGTNLFKIHYRDLSTRGVFHEIFKLMCVCMEYPDIINIPVKEVAKAGGIKERTVYMFRAYVQTGWKRRS